MAKLPWKPWHEVVKLRDDLRSGELPMHMFAADSKRGMGNGVPRVPRPRHRHFFVNLQSIMALFTTVVYGVVRRVENGYRFFCVQ